MVDIVRLSAVDSYYHDLNTVSCPSIVTTVSAWQLCITKLALKLSYSLIPQNKFRTNC